VLFVLQTELLDPEMNALEYMMKEYKDIPLEKMRSVVSCCPATLWCCDCKGSARLSLYQSQQAHVAAGTFMAGSRLQ